MGGKDTILTKLLVPPVVNEGAAMLAALRFSATIRAEFETLKLLMVGCAVPTNSVPLVTATGLAESVNAPDFPETSNVAPLITEMDELLATAPAPLSASTPLLTTVLPV